MTYFGLVVLFMAFCRELRLRTKYKMYWICPCGRTTSLTEYSRGYDTNFAFHPGMGKAGQHPFWNTCTGCGRDFHAAFKYPAVLRGRPGNRTSKVASVYHPEYMRDLMQNGKKEYKVLEEII